MILAVVGLQREARIAAGEGVRVIIGGGNSGDLRRKLDDAVGAGVQGVASFGIAGALSPMLSTGDCVLASAVRADGKSLHTDGPWRKAIGKRLPGCVVAELLGTDSIIATAYEKRRMFARTAAHAVDTETHIAGAVAVARNLPFVAIRVIVDTANTDLPPVALCAIRRDGTVDTAAVVRSLISRPRQIPQLIRTGQDSRIAFRTLLRCREALGPAFSFPELG